MKRLLKNLFIHWKTSLSGIIVAILTYMMYCGKIAVHEWAEGLGVIITVISLLAKDWDKTEQ